MKKVLIAVAAPARIACSLLVFAAWSAAARALGDVALARLEPRD